MTTNEALNAAKVWAVQTFIFAMSEKECDGPIEVLEQIHIRASSQADRLMKEAAEDCRDNPGPAPVMQRFVTKVLDWIGENRPDTR